MLELARELLPLVRADARLAAVTVVGVARSAPRGVGATMAVTADGRVIGSISGGCVEGDAVVLAHTARVTGRPQTARLGFSDDAAHAAGLACGGSVDVVAYPVMTDAATVAALEAAAAGRRAAIALPLPDGDTVIVTAEPAPQLIIVGAGEHAAALCRIAAASGFSVTVVDVWEALVTRERFPEAAQTSTALPHEFLATVEVDDRTAVCVLTHDERLDVPALAAALRMPVGFVGAMGARGTVARRAELLRESGITDDELARLHSPLGLDLGGSTPAETAIAVLAEITASRHRASGRPLRDIDGPLHRHASTATADRPGTGAPAPVGSDPSRSADTMLGPGCAPRALTTPTGASA
ncbi:XdhC family protein [Planococcus sp. APC 4015]|nr:XdhC family protein [Planococcus sp. APC 4015]